jgi:hypothetical protein
VTLGSLPYRSSALSFSYFAPQNDCELHINMYVHIYIYIYMVFIRIMENLCHYTPEPHVPNHSELGPWGLG